MTLSELVVWVQKIPGQMPSEIEEMAQSIVNEFLRTAERLTNLGLSYLSLDRAGSTLSNGELQRVQISRAVRSDTTGVLYVLDEPSIGLHPYNVDGLMKIVRELVDRKNSVVLVDHDPRILMDADQLIEIGPGAGKEGGRIVTQGTPLEAEKNPHSLIGPYLSGKESLKVRSRATEKDMFENGSIRIKTKPFYTVQALDVSIPKGRMIAVTGVSDSGKTALAIECLVPALQAVIQGTKLPEHVDSIEAKGIQSVKVIDSKPIGAERSLSPLLLMTAYLMTCGNYLQELPMPRQRVLRLETFHTTRANCAVRYVTEPALSRWMFSSFRMSIRSVRVAEAPDTEKTLMTSFGRARKKIPCRFLCRVC